LAGATPPDQFRPFLKSFGPVAGTEFVIENVAPPVVDTETDDGTPAVTPVSVIDVYGPVDGRPVAISSENSVMELAFHAERRAFRMDATVSVPVAV